MVQHAIMNFHDNQPITYWGRVPVYAATLLVAALAVGVVLTTLLMAMQSSLLGWLALSVPLRAPWTVWQFVTYPFIDAPSFFTIFGLFFCYSMGTGLESHIGRSQFIRLILVLVLAVPLLFFVLYLLGLGLTIYSGSYLLSVGLMVAFATLYPNTEAFGWVPMKWLIFASLVMGSLVELSDRNFTRLLALWGTAGIAFAFIQNYKGEGPVTALTDWWQRRRSKLRLVPRPGSPSRPAKSHGKTKAAIDHRAEVDRILEKISKEGISSLTGKERAFLEAASDRMKGKPKRDPDSEED
jgi:hypothetical protein